MTTRTPVLELSIYNRREEERLCAETMFVEIHPENDTAAGYPGLALDMHRNGIGLLVDRPLQDDQELFISIAMKGIYVGNLKSRVKHLRELKPGIWRIGVEFDRTHLSFHNGLRDLMRIENFCIEKQLSG